MRQTGDYKLSTVSLLIAGGDAATVAPTERKVLTQKDIDDGGGKNRNANVHVTPE